MATMSPASPSSIGWRSRPRKARILETRPFSISVPSRREDLDRSGSGLSVPALMRPVMMRPRKGLASRMVPSMRNGPVLDRRRRHVLEHEVEQRREPWSFGPSGAGRHPAVAARAVEDREVELLVGGVERREQVEHLVDDLVGPRVRTVDLVDRPRSASGRPSAPCRPRTWSAASALRRRRPARWRRRPCPGCARPRRRNRRGRGCRRC